MTLPAAAAHPHHVHQRCRGLVWSLVEYHRSWGQVDLPDGETAVRASVVDAHALERGRRSLGGKGRTRDAWSMDRAGER